MEIKKKAAIQIEVLAVFIIMAFALLFFGTGAGKIALEKAGNLKNLLPGFNSSEIKVEDVEQVRYNIPIDEVDYYTGTRWEPFTKKSIILNDRKYSGSEVRQAFFDYYYNFADRRQYFGNDLFYSTNNPSSYGWREVFYPTRSDIPALKAQIVFFLSYPEEKPSSSALDAGLAAIFFGNPYNENNYRQRGDILATLRNTDPTDTRIYGQVVVRNDGTVLFRKADGSSFVEWKATEHFGLDNFLKEVVLWRDSILNGGEIETTLDVPYTYLGERSSVTVEVERISNFLVADISRSVESKKPEKAVDELPIANYDFSKYSFVKSGEKDLIYYDGSYSSFYGARKRTSYSSRYYLFYSQDSEQEGIIIADVDNNIINFDQLKLADERNQITSSARDHARALDGHSIEEIPKT